MTRRTSRRLAVLGCLGVLALAALLAATLDADGLRGAAIGTGLGLVNLGVGAALTRRTLSKGIGSTTAVMLGGFMVRLVVLAVLMLVFERTHGVSAASFGVSFVVLFFAYLAAEMVMVRRHAGTRPAAMAPSGQVTAP